MPTMIVVVATVVATYLVAVAYQYELHRTVVRRLRPAPVIAGRPQLRLVVDNSRPALQRLDRPAS